MEQHAVPQPITSYEFRLVGDMTLKQFGKLASGVILALIVYGINPAPGILKWALIMLFVGLGVGMAFLPFQGRPLDVWIVSFFKRIYSPTQYVWRMGGPLNIRPSYEQATNQSSNDQPWIQRQTAEDREQKTDDRFQKTEYSNQQVASSKQPVISPSDLSSVGNIDQKVTPPVFPSDTELWHEGKPLQPSEITPEAQTKEAPTVLYDSPQYPQLPQSPISPQSPLDQVTVGKTTIYSADSQNQPATDHRSLITDNRPTVPPAFNPSLVIPTLPDIPNILGGFVKNTEGKLVEGAIIEVRDSVLNPVRAFKTNKLGQFQIATPLPNGIYEIETEKDGLTFDIIKIELKGEILPPFEIIAKQNIVH